MKKTTAAQEALLRRARKVGLRVGSRLERDFSVRHFTINHLDDDRLEAVIAAMEQAGRRLAPLSAEERVRFYPRLAAR
jgi:hypothetical protein